MTILISLAVGLLILKVILSLLFYFSPDPWHFYSRLFEELGMIDPEKGDHIHITTRRTRIPDTAFYYIEFDLSPNLNITTLRNHLNVLSEHLDAPVIHIEPTRSARRAVMVYAPIRY